jgi:hypothetical protein
MKKIFIGSFVGALILFIWSFLAWSILPLHLHTFTYTPAQDSILKVLSGSGMETGVYLAPMVDNRNVHGIDHKYMEDSHKYMEEKKGQPMVTLYYLKNGMEFGPANIIRGFIFDLLALLAACILLSPAFATVSTFFGRWWLSLMVGLLITASGPLIYYNWLAVPWDFTVDMVLDVFMNWGITGLWLAWYFRK